MDGEQGHNEKGCCGGCGHTHHAPSPAAPAKKRKTLLWASILAAASHIFCCVLPGVFGLLALLSGVGIIVTLPGWLEAVHERMHHIEVPMLVISGLIVGAGWLSHFYSSGHDCHAVGECHHESCQPRKKQVCRILLLATVLFAINLAVYFGLHAPVNLPVNLDAHLHE